MAFSKQNPLPIVTGHLRPGTRLGVAVSGGADSVALLLRLAELRGELGLVLTVLHVHHGIRGAEADADADFVAELAQRLELRFLRHDVNALLRADEEQESLEEAARKLRYAWFESLLEAGELNAVATAHTLDDQAETVLLKLLRGAWTEGLGGIFPVLERAGGLIVRPLLGTRRSEIEQWLKSIGQVWREDSSNREDVYTRNRVRRHLLPVLEEYNPKIAEQLVHMAAIARDEDAYWQRELGRILPSLVLPGRAVRGGGRASSTQPGETSVGMEIEKLRALYPAVRRRVLRAAAEQMGCGLNFEQTELLMAMAEAKAGRRETLTADLHAERTPRELRLVRATTEKPAKMIEYELSIPGEIAAEFFGIHLTVRASEGVEGRARLRTWRAGDRVRLRYSSGPKRMKEVFERLRVPPAERTRWPVLEWREEIVWMRGAEVESQTAASTGLKVEAHPLT